MRPADDALAGGGGNLDRDPARFGVSAVDTLGRRRGEGLLIVEAPLEHVARVQDGTRIVEHCAHATDGNREELVHGRSDTKHSSHRYAHISRALGLPVPPVHPLHANSSTVPPSTSTVHRYLASHPPRCFSTLLQRVRLCCVGLDRADYSSLHITLIVVEAVLRLTSDGFGAVFRWVFASAS